MPNKKTISLTDRLYEALDATRKELFESRSEECLQLLICAQHVGYRLTLAAHEADFNRGPFFISKIPGAGGPTFLVATEKDKARLSGIIGSAKHDKEGFKDWWERTSTVSTSRNVTVRVPSIKIGDPDLPPELCVSMEAIEEMHYTFLADEGKPKKGKKKKAVKEQEPAMPRDL